MDEELRKQIEARIAQLEAEGRGVANLAADQAYAPYLAAIGELRRVLQSFNQPAPAPVPAPAKKKS